MLKRIVIGLLIGSSIPFILLAIYLFRPLSYTPHPANFECVSLADGRFEALEPKAGYIYGIGLSYSQHIDETASSFDPNESPPIFEKSRISLSGHGQKIAMPSRKDLIQALEGMEPGLGQRVDENFEELPVLLDYEVELAFVLLEDIQDSDFANEDFAPDLGFFLANDVSSRIIAVLGEGQPNRYDYWGLSKSFPGFLPVSDRIWIPNESGPRTLPCITIESHVNDEQRQSSSTSDMIYTPAELIRYIHKKYPDRKLKKGDIVLMGTPGGVAFQTPRWLARMASLVSMDRFGKLRAVLRRDTRFLEVGDQMRIQAEGFDAVENEIVYPQKNHP